jgi:hypothetical protein
MITGVILVGIVVLFVILESAVPQGKNILETNLSQNLTAMNAAADNVLVTLTSITLSGVGEDGTVILMYSAPGASNFLLVQEKDGDLDGNPEVVDTLDTPESFTSIPPHDDVSMFSLPLFATTVESSGTENCITYFYRLRACDHFNMCLISDVVSATPQPIEGCP